MGFENRLEAGDWSDVGNVVIAGPEYSRKVRPISVPDKIGISYVHVGHKGHQGRASEGQQKNSPGLVSRFRRRSTAEGSLAATRRRSARQ
jgi:hypothetical protein